jgi:hypothetical protein
MDHPAVVIDNGEERSTVDMEAVRETSAIQDDGKRSR